MKTQKRSLFVKTVLAVLVITGGVFMTGCTNGSDETVANTDAKIAEYLKEISISELTQQDKDVLVQLAGMELQFGSYEHPAWVVGHWEFIIDMGEGKNNIQTYIFHENGKFVFENRANFLEQHSLRAGEWFCNEGKIYQKYLEGDVGNLDIEEESGTKKLTYRTPGFAWIWVKK